MEALHAEPPVHRPEHRLETAIYNWYDALHGSEYVPARQVTMKTPYWPGVGKVDLALVGLQVLWLEVKWSELWNCPWDVAKLALAVREQLCDEAYLFAAAPAAAWAAEVDGAEYFAHGDWDTAADVLERYRKHWLYWKRAVKTRPIRLPAQIRTDGERLPGSTFRVGSARWELRAALITPIGDDWIDVDEERHGHRPVEP